MHQRRSGSQGHLAHWSLLAGAAALLVGGIEITLTTASFPTAASRIGGWAGAALGVWWCCLAIAWPIALVAAELERRDYDLGRLPRWLPRLVLPLTLGGVAFAVTRTSTYRDVQIDITTVRVVLLGGALLTVFVVLDLLHALGIRVGARLGALADALGRWAPIAALVVVWLGSQVLVHEVLAPVHAVELILPLGLAAVASALLLLGAAPIARSAPRYAPQALLLAWLVAPLVWRGSPHARFVLQGHAPLSTIVLGALDRAADLDSDGTGPRWLLGTDCAELDAGVGPLVLEIPGDGIDQDCRGGDAGPAQAPTPGAVFGDCRPPKGPLSVILITVDALRADAVTPRTAPELAGFMSQAVRFDRAYAPSTMTGASTLAWFSGHTLSDLSEKNPDTDPEVHVPRSLGEAYRDAGYRAFAVLPFDVPAAVSRGLSPPEHALPVDPVPDHHKRLVSADLSNRFLQEMASIEHPTFAWVHYADLHAPYILAVDGDAGTLPGYVRALRYTDRHIGRVLRTLHQTGWLERSVVVLTSDHGEQLGDRGREGHGPLVFEEAIHVPLGLWIPGCAPRAVSAPVSVGHLAGTLQVLTGVALDDRPRSSWLAPSRLPVVAEEPETAWGGFKRAVLHRDHKLIIDVRTGGRMLFDLARDPRELKNIDDSDGDASRVMQDAYQRWLDAKGLR
jgi:arylsulfatase A-like enzyme